MEGIEFEPIESPEYIKFCEEGNRGYRHGISTCGNWMRQKCFNSNDTKDKSFRYVIMSTFDPFSSQQIALKPYRISSVDGTYKSASDQVNDFLNSMQHGLMMPNGSFEEIKAPMFGVNYKKDE